MVDQYSIYYIELSSVKHFALYNKGYSDKVSKKSLRGKCLLKKLAKNSLAVIQKSINLDSPAMGPLGALLKL